MIWLMNRRLQRTRPDVPRQIRARMVAQFAQLHPVWHSDLHAKYETRINGDMKTRHGGETMLDMI